MIQRLKMTSFVMVGLVVMLFVATPATAEFPVNNIAVGEQALTLNGEGMRKKLFIDLYQAALYLPEKSSDANKIVAADQPMAIQLHIVSSLITPKKMSSATLEGFEKSTGGNITPIKDRVDQMLAVFEKGIKEGDAYEFSYQPGAGVTISLNGSPAASIPGLDFKQALFGIWLSDDPVQSSLKKALLGN